MTSTQLGWLAYGFGGLLVVGGMVAAVYGLRPIRLINGPEKPMDPPVSVPDEEPSGTHTATADTAPHDRASVLVDTGQLSTAELAILLADGAPQ